jgi:hypothetical protein
MSNDFECRLCMKLFVVIRCFSEFAVTASFLMSPILEKLIGKDFLMETSQREKKLMFERSYS